MFGSKCHVSVLVYLLCLCNYNVKGGKLVETSEVKSAINVPATHAPPEVTSKGTEVSPVTSAVESSSSTSAPIKGKPVKDEPITVGPDVTPLTIPADPDNPSTSAGPPITTAKTTTSTSASTTTVTTPTSSAATTSTSTVTTSTATTSTSSVSPNTPTTSTKATSTTEKPASTTAAPVPHHSRQFDGPSFIGGIVLASGLMAIGFVAFKFYKARTERNYHTL